MKLTKNTIVFIGFALALIAVTAISFGLYSSKPVVTTTTTSTTTTTTNPVIQKWNLWQSGFDPLLTSTGADYISLQADLSSADLSGSTTMLTKLASDTQALSAQETSPSVSVNKAVATYVSDLQKLINDGNTLLANGQTTNFLVDVSAIAKDSTALTTALQNPQLPQ
jgi:hypothetical protein